jgi:hypothetical protein
MRIGVALDERKVLNDSGTAQSTDCPLRDRIFDLPLHFRELRPAVAGETKGETVVDGGFFTALSTQYQGPTAKMTKG